MGAARGSEARFPRARAAARRRRMVCRSQGRITTAASASTAPELTMSAAQSLHVAMWARAVAARAWHADVHWARTRARTSLDEMPEARSADRHASGQTPDAPSSARTSALTARSAPSCWMSGKRDSSIDAMTPKFSTHERARAAESSADSSAGFSGSAAVGGTDASLAAGGADAPNMEPEKDRRQSGASVEKWPAVRSSALPSGATLESSTLCANGTPASSAAAARARLKRSTASWNANLSPAARLSSTTTPGR
mmetsp:Transcript_139156/g.197037  ORF Transcript_139156/g.197037 Transcript_139156/m.197037 type:complete len:254 (+) Transcript_139156:376-1137(+)